MRLILDFSGAGETPCHRYIGVRAAIDGASPVVVSIDPDGCRLGDEAGPSGLCPDPAVDVGQARAVAMLLTGRTDCLPVGDGAWDPASGTMTFALRAGRPPIMDVNPLPAS